MAETREDLIQWLRHERPDTVVGATVARLRAGVPIDELIASDHVFSPRRLPALLAELLADGPPPEPFDVGV